MDLWAELPHEDGIAAISVGMAEPEQSSTVRGIRRYSERETLAIWRDWLIESYAPAYCRALGEMRIFRRCYWVDALGTNTRKRNAGQPEVTQIEGGKKRKEPVPRLLEPIIQLAQMLQQESRPIALYGLLLQAESSRRKETSQVPTNKITPIILPRESGLLTQSWSEAGVSVLKEIEQTPAIFLLNPFGANIFSHENLAALYQRAVPTELCLLLFHKQIESHLRAASKNTVQASALTNLLRSDRWKTLPLAVAEREQMIVGLVSLLSASMQRHFKLPIQIIRLSVPHGPASQTYLPQTLLFATRRAESLASMNNAICRYQRQSEEQSYRGVLGEEWFLTQSQERQEQARHELNQRIQQQGQAQRARRWPDLRQQLMQQNFGQFTIEEYDSQLQQLLQHNILRCMWQKLPSQLDERVPGNNDTLIWG